MAKFEKRRGGVGIRVKWVETRRDGSTSRDQSVAPRQPLPDLQGRAKGLAVSGRCRPVSIPRCPCYTRPEIVVLGFSSRHTNSAEIETVPLSSTYHLVDSSISLRTRFPRQTFELSRRSERGGRRVQPGREGVVFPLRLHYP